MILSIRTARVDWIVENAERLRSCPRAVERGVIDGDPDGG
jgi:hypothetical protein